MEMKLTNPQQSFKVAAQFAIDVTLNSEQL
jgi:hypothetical protein